MKTPSVIRKLTENKKVSLEKWLVKEKTYFDYTN